MSSNATAAHPAAAPVEHHRADTRLPGLSTLPADRVHKNLITHLESMHRAEGGAVLCFGEIVRRGLFRELGYASIHDYAERALGFSQAKTYQFLRIAEALRGLPRVRRAVASGRLCWTKARSVTQVATRNTETAWLKEAREHTRDALQLRVRQALARAGARGKSKPQTVLPLALQAENAQPVTRTLADASGEVHPVSHETRPAGKGLSAMEPPAGAADPANLADTADSPDLPNTADSACAAGSVESCQPIPTETAPPAAAVTVSFRLDAEEYARYQALVEAARKQGNHESKNALMLGAMEALVLTGSHRRDACGCAGGCACAQRPSEDPGAQSATGSRPGPDTNGRAANCVRIDGQTTSGVRCHCTAVQSPARSPYQVTVQFCPVCERGVVPTTRGPREIPPDRLRAILCDSDVQSVGKRNRATVPPAVRREVLARDRHQCRVAGCSNTRFLQVHHLIPREAGGPNKPANLVTLCSACHRWAHEEDHAKHATAPAGTKRTG